MDNKKYPSRAGIRRDDEKELLNYKKAMDFISKYLGKDDPVSEGLVRELHKIIVRGVRGSIYTPPAPFDVPFLMREFVEWINRNIREASPVLTAGIAQFQFVHIHPFVDGNGRTARLLSTLILYKTGYDFKRLFTISEYYDRDRPAYYKAIQSVRNKQMDMTTWLEYFVNGLRSQMKEIQEKGKGIIKNDAALQKLKQKDLNERQRKAVKFLLQNGKMTVSDYQALSFCIRRTAQRDLKDLVRKNVIKVMASSPTNPTKYYVLL
ncbi:MAG: Fic family protein [Victivallaceae bacterium]|nr:Fic family protein [Victivallaceae bacterium]